MAESLLFRTSVELLEFADQIHVCLSYCVPAGSVGRTRKFLISDM